MTDTVVYEIDSTNSGVKTYVSLPPTYKVTLGPGVPGSRGGMAWMFRAYEDAGKKSCVLALPAAGYRRTDIAVVQLSNNDSSLKNHFARMTQAQETAAMLEGRVIQDTEKAVSQMAAAIGLYSEDTPVDF